MLLVHALAYHYGKFYSYLMMPIKILTSSHLEHNRITITYTFRPIKIRSSNERTFLSIIFTKKGDYHAHSLIPKNAQYTTALSKNQPHMTRVSK